MAGKDGYPILLTDTDRVPTQTLAALRRLNPTRIVILGGEGVVTDAVARTLKTYTL